MKSTSEYLVFCCFEQHIKTPDEFIYTGEERKYDEEGIDFIVCIKGFRFNLQVKNSTKTIGLVLPIEKDDTTNFLITERMWKRILEHRRKHAEVRHLLFVAPTNRPEIIEEIWKQTKKIAIPAKQYGVAI